MENTKSNAPAAAVNPKVSLSSIEWKHSNKPGMDLKKDVTHLGDASIDNKENAELKIEKPRTTEKGTKHAEYDSKSDPPPSYTAREVKGRSDVKNRKSQTKEPRQTVPLPPTTPQAEKGGLSNLPGGWKSWAKGKKPINMDMSILNFFNHDDAPFPRSPLPSKQFPPPPKSLQQQRLFGPEWNGQHNVRPEDEIAHMPYVWLVKDPTPSSSLKQAERGRIMQHMDAGARKDVRILLDKGLVNDAEALLRGHKMAMDRKMTVEKRLWGQKEGQVFRKRFDELVTSSPDKDPRYGERLSELGELLKNFENQREKDIKKQCISPDQFVVIDLC